MYPRQKSPIVFIHTAKTGGTSFIDYVGSFFPGRRVCHATFPKDLRTYSKEELAEFSFFAGHFGMGDCEGFPDNCSYVTLLRDPVERVVSLYYWWQSHIKRDYIGTPDNDPNCYGVRLAMESSLEDFIETGIPSVLCEISNTQARYIVGTTRNDLMERLSPDDAFTLAKETLSKQYAWFGTMDSLMDSAGELKKSLHLDGVTHRVANLKHGSKGMKYLNRGGKKLIVKPETAERIRKMNEVDARLYAWVKSHQQEKRQAPASKEAVVAVS